MMLTILNVLPQFLNGNGDSENALVLEKRARWAGVDAEVVTACSGTPDIVVIGSGFDGDIRSIAAQLHSIEPLLARSVLRSVPMLAVGLGLELLGTRVVMDDETEVTGLGLLPGEAVPMDSRANGEIVVECGVGTLVGYENHCRSYRIAESTPALGTVLAGVGNGDATRREGIVMDLVIGTHIHGPVLAKNPRLADQMLMAATNGNYSPDNPRSRWTDSLAAVSRAKVLGSLGLPAEPARGRSQPTTMRLASWPT